MYLFDLSVKNRREGDGGWNLRVRENSRETECMLAEGAALQEGGNEGWEKGGHSWRKVLICTHHPLFLYKPRTLYCLHTNSQPHYVKFILHINPALYSIVFHQSPVIHYTLYIPLDIRNRKKLETKILFPSPEIFISWKTITKLEMKNVFTRIIECFIELC